MTIYLNGQYLNNNVALNVNDRGYLLGDGVFETLLCQQSKPIWFTEHWRRLCAGANYLGIPISQDEKSVKQAVFKLLQLHQYEADASVRITLTRGTGPRGLMPPATCQPTLLMQAFRYQHVQRDHYTATISAIVRNEKSPLSCYKTLNYLDAVVAKQQASASGFDDAILLNTQGFVVCTTCANLFVEKDGLLYTPDIASGALPGITRAKLIELAKANGKPVIEKPINQTELHSADVVFICNSLIGTQVVTHIDNTHFNATHLSEFNLSFNS